MVFQPQVLRSTRVLLRRKKCAAGEKAVNGSNEVTRSLGFENQTLSLGLANFVG